MPQTDISCIMTFHAEGLLAYRSLTSLQRAVDYCRKRGGTVEKVFVLDAATNATREAASRFAPEVLAEVAVRDAALARNEGVRRASGEYVAFWDADDLFSENWLDAAWRRLRETPYDAVLHPQFSISFGAAPRHCEFRPNQDDPGCFAGNLFTHNLWGYYDAFTRRSIALKFPQETARPESGFGYEDWHWNTLTVAGGIKHEVAPFTCQCYRRKARGSLFLAHLSSNSTLRRSPFFDDVRFFKPSPDGAAGIDRGPASLAESRLIRRAVLRSKAQRNMRKALRLWWEALHYSTSRLLVKASPKMLRGPLTAMEQRISRALTAGSPVELPDWVMDELKQLSRIEPEIFPDRALLSQTEFYPTCFPPVEEALVYGKVLEAVGSRSCSHVLLAAAPAREHADAEAAHFARALACDFKKSVLLILTENEDSSWAAALPPEVAVLDFGGMAGGLSTEQRIAILVRLLIQLQPSVIHDTGSFLGWSLYCRHGQCLKESSLLYASIFRDRHTKEGRPSAGIQSFLFDAHPHLAGVICDDPECASFLCRVYGFSEAMFQSIHLPEQPAIALNPDEAARSANNARGLVSGPHSRSRFVESVAAIRSYLNGSGGG
jgi:hypothetical protein